MKENLRKIKVDDDLGIILSDGCRLSARTWMPENAHEFPVPAILEYLPYRKRDGTVARDELTHPYFANSIRTRHWARLGPGFTWAHAPYKMLGYVLSLPTVSPL